jgi:hypothetical protein
MKGGIKNMENKIAITIFVALFLIGGLLGAVFKPAEIVNVEVPVEKIVEVERIVEVPVVSTEAGSNDILLTYAYDNDGDLTLLDIKDLDEDELDQVNDRILFLETIKAAALEHVKAELFDEVDKEMVNSTELDEDELERLKLDDDADEVIVTKIDFEDSDAYVTVFGTFEQDDVKFKFEAEVEFKDGEVEDFSVKTPVLDLD